MRVVIVRSARGRKKYIRGGENITEASGARGTWPSIKSLSLAKLLSNAIRIDVEDRG